MDCSVRYDCVIDGNGNAQLSVVNLTSCSPFATCRSKNGQPTCVCNNGYSGNGTQCFLGISNFNLLLRL